MVNSDNSITLSLRPGLRPLRPRVIFDNSITEFACFSFFVFSEAGTDMLKLTTVSHFLPVPARPGVNLQEYQGICLLQRKK